MVAAYPIGNGVGCAEQIREAAEVQRFQASLSAFTLFWNYLAVVSFILWVLFYLVH